MINFYFITINVLTKVTLFSCSSTEVLGIIWDEYNEHKLLMIIVDIKRKSVNPFEKDY